MDRIYKYNSDASYKPNGGTYLQLITAKDFTPYNGYFECPEFDVPRFETPYILNG